MKSLLLLLALLAPLPAQFQTIDPPALPDSGMPLLTAAPNGAVYLSWTETTAEKHHLLRFAKWTGKAWTPPETITEGRNWFINWADFGSLNVLPNGSMLAHWLTRSAGGGKFGYGIRIAKRDPNRPVWRQIHGLSLDEPVDYAGFLTFAPGTNAATYLAPPSGKAPAASHHEGHGDEHGHRKTARFIEFRPDGSIAADLELDADVCSCCQTALGKTGNGWIAVYRDHMPGEIRDISIVRYADGAWTAPRTLHPDGWKINGCPTEGPSLLARDSRIAIAWLTRANGQPKIQLSISANDGQDFAAPIRIDSGNPLGRPSLAFLDASNYLVTWLEKTPGGGVEIRLRQVSRDGHLGQALTVAQAPVGRASGFPKVIVSGEQIFLAWRDAHVRALLLNKSQLKDKK